MKRSSVWFINIHRSLLTPASLSFYSCWLLVHDGVGTIAVRLSLCTSKWPIAHSSPFRIAPLRLRDSGEDDDDDGDGD